MTRQLSPATPKVNKLSIVAPVNKGGTGGSDTVSAAVSLGAMSTNDLGKAGGPLKLLPGKAVDPANLPASFPKGATLDGPSAFYVSRVHTLTISNYDKASDASYAVSVTGGTVSRSGSTITFTGPASPGVVQLTVGTRTVNIQVKAPGVLQPTIVTPVDGATNQAATVAVQSSAFQVSSGSASHQYTDWELSTAADFSTMVASSFNDATNKTTWSVSGLSTATAYYLRCRYKDNVLGYSDWSNASKFTTKASFVVSSEEAKLSASDKVAADAFGTSASMSSDGTRVAIGVLFSDPSGIDAAGATYIFVRTGTTWTQEQKLVASDQTTGAHLGRSAKISADGIRCITGGDTGVSNGVSNAGCCYVFVRNTSTNVWTQEQKLLPAVATAGWAFGYAASIDNTGTRAAVGEYNSTGNSVTSGGQVYIFLRTGSTWAQEAKFTPTDVLAGDLFGASLAISGDGSRMVASAQSSDSNPGSVANAGAAYVYSRTGTTWSQEAKFLPSTPTANGVFGIGIAISSDGTRIALSETGPAASNPGYVYVYLRTNTTWALEQKFTSSDGAVGDNFGGAISIEDSGSRIIIGAQSNKPSALTNAGSVYIFSRSGSVWSQASKITASDKAAGDYFGHAVAYSQDGTRAVIASYQATVGGVATCGAAYILA